MFIFKIFNALETRPIQGYLVPRGKDNFLSPLSTRTYIMLYTYMHIRNIFFVLLLLRKFNPFGTSVTYMCCVEFVRSLILSTSIYE